MYRQNGVGSYYLRTAALANSTSERLDGFHPENASDLGMHSMLTALLLLCALNFSLCRRRGRGHSNQGPVDSSPSRAAAIVIASPRGPIQCNCVKIAEISPCLG
ncbi:hypothetical protein AcV5_004390 [Taiwanofungus camphoratus]|nr:hypothetical protein AcV5_004390 [Antrodia cinnamomea]